MSSCWRPSRKSDERTSVNKGEPIYRYKVASLGDGRTLGGSEGEKGKHEEQRANHSDVRGA